MKKINLLNKSFLQLNRLVVYREIARDKLLKKFSLLVSQLADKPENKSDNMKKEFYELCSNLFEIAEMKKYEGDIWYSYLLDLIITDENIFTMMCEKYGSNLGENLRQAAIHDIKILRKLFYYNIYNLGRMIDEDMNFLQAFSPTARYSIKSPFLKKITKFKNMFRKEKNNSKKIVDNLIDYYYNYGTGDMAHYTTFRWSNNCKLKGIRNPDPVSFNDLIGYKVQKEKLIKNTEAFLRGRKANNVLLFGASGTGKSSSIKALVNKYYDKGLRLLAIEKHQINKLPDILEILKERGLYYIIFMDDLSFADFETNYKYLKALMEGGVETKPVNVLFYATSNRRHLIKEKWSDRSGENREIHLSDAIQEKFSLVDRFGITLNYQAPDKESFIRIVKGLAERNNINMNNDKLIKKALQWEQRHNGMSGRTAQQFINYLEVEV